MGYRKEGISPKKLVQFPGTTKHGAQNPQRGPDSSQSKWGLRGGGAWRLNSFNFLFYFLNNFIYFGCAGSSLLLGVFPSCKEQGGYSLVSVVRLLIAASLGVQPRLGAQYWAGSVLSGSWALEHWLSSHVTGASLLQGTWGLPGPGTEHESPASAGGFFITEPPGKLRFKFLGSNSDRHLIALLEHRELSQWKNKGINTKKNKVIYNKGNMIIRPDLSHGEQYFDIHDNVSIDPNCDITQ